MPRRVPISISSNDMALPLVFHGNAAHLQVGNHGVHLALAFYGSAGARDVFLAVGHTEKVQSLHLLGGVLTIQGVFHQPGVGGHLRLRYHVARVVQVRAVPFIRVAAAGAGPGRGWARGEGGGWWSPLPSAEPGGGPGRGAGGAGGCWMRKKATP